ncbi:polyhydroxyalkanoic acid synthase [Bradyrhizobium sp. NAS80.1]|uniref:polyhydroxyalkanoic acid system family protein n=1 Tax=Bradyrhizobium sp. NAS80.1 TaxID=1680159 RepID=UPI000964DF6E|nr:polyhydroxyalkanoic acid system family protein [Bradyrhizobium sp. NAS80.1]OKO79027.1 polyhydroxyalkanoic acid synthase [Bradyrhizobium sp. NAS80.1]
MSAPLVVSIPHRLGREEAVRRLKTSLGRAAASIPVIQVEEQRWTGDSMNFRIRALGQIASGQVDVADDHVKVQVMLPWLLQRFAEMAQATIRKRGQLLLTKDKGK